MSLAFHVVVLGQARHECRIFAQLLWVTQNDLRAAVIVADRPFDFHRVALQLPDISDVLQIAREHHHREGTGPVVFAEIKEGHTLAAFFHLQHGSADAFRFPNVLPRLGECDAIRGDSAVRNRTGSNRQQYSMQRPTHDWVSKARPWAAQRLPLSKLYGGRTEN